MCFRRLGSDELAAAVLVEGHQDRLAVVGGEGRDQPLVADDPLVGTVALGLTPQIERHRALQLEQDRLDARSSWRLSASATTSAWKARCASSLPSSSPDPLVRPAHLLQLRPDGSAGSRVRRPQRERRFDRVPFEAGAAEQLLDVGLGQFGDSGAAARYVLDEALLGQHPQCLAERGPADGEAGADLFLDEPRAGRQASGEDVLA